MYNNKDSNTIYPIEKVMINRNQEDVDLIIAYLDDELYRIILVEAKGTGSWTNKQLASKVQKLQDIFGEHLEYCPDNVKIHFVLASPKKPKNLKLSDWPHWVFGKDGIISWILLDIPENRIQISRCNAKGASDKNGAYWRRVIKP